MNQPSYFTHLPVSCTCFHYLVQLSPIAGWVVSSKFFFSSSFYSRRLCSFHYTFLRMWISIFCSPLFFGSFIIWFLNMKWLTSNCSHIICFCCINWIKYFVCYHFSRTILYLSFVYTIGSVVVALGAIPTLHLPTTAVTIIGLLLIAIGTGGIKPCVSAFGGDQFKLPEQAKFLVTFFSLFYVSINAGSVLSSTITPILREEVHCFGELSCYSLAFGVPGMLMVASIGKKVTFDFKIFWA